MLSRPVAYPIPDARGGPLLAESSPPTFGIARAKPAGQDVPPERLLPGDEVGRGGTRTRPKAAVQKWVAH